MEARQRDRLDRGYFKGEEILACEATGVTVPFRSR
jgi:hypothetical protein